MFKKRIPTFVGMLLLLVGAVAGVLLLDQSTGFLPRAAPEYIPQKTKITNISDTGFTISWITQEPTIGFIKMGTDPESLATTVVDERDQLTGSSGEFRSHYITVQGLTPTTNYYFKLGSHGKQLYDNDGESFSLTTAPAVSAPPNSDTAYGTVLTPAQTPAEGAIIYATLPGSTPLSALVKQNGNWAISLSLARTANLNSYVEYDLATSALELLVQSDNGDTTQVITVTGNDQPVPDIIVGQNADYTSADPTIVDRPTDVELTSKFSLQALTVTDPDESNITITTIPADNTIVGQTKPQIAGSAPPGVTLTVTVQSPAVVTGNVAVDTQGNWNWTPPQDLEPGPHTITLSYADQEGILRALSRTFVIQAADNLPEYSATPSATLTPTTPPTPTNIPDPTSPPSTLTPKPTTPAPTKAPSATASALPQAGVTGPTLYLLFLGIGIILIGLITRKMYTNTRHG